MELAFKYLNPVYLSKYIQREILSKYIQYRVRNLSPPEPPNIEVVWPRCHLVLSLFDGRFWQVASRVFSEQKINSPWKSTFFPFRKYLKL